MSRRLPAAARMSALALALAAPAAALAEAPGWRLVAPESGAEAVLRAAPDPAAEAVEDLPAGTLVTLDGAAEDAPDGRWLRLARPDRPDGWLPAAALAPARWQGLDGTVLPVAGFCGGVEPMWSLRWTEDEAVLDLGDRVLSHAAPAAAETEGGGPAQLLIAGADPADRLLLVFENAACTAWPLDDLVWGAGALIATEAGAPRLLRGCCSPSAAALAPAQ